MKAVFFTYICPLIFILITIPVTNTSSESSKKQIILYDQNPIITCLPIPILGLSDGSSKWNSNDDSLIIPLRRAGRIYLIEAKVDNVTGYLVFDTGASGVVLNKTYFRDHVVIDNQYSSGITGTVGAVEYVAVDRLTFSGLQFSGVTAQMTNLGHIENRRGVKVLGLIGFSMLKDFELVLDTEQNQLQLYRINKKGLRLNSDFVFTADYTTTFDFYNNILFIRLPLQGKDNCFCFDTGAETNVVDRYATKSLLNSITITRRSTLTGAGSQTSDVLFGTMNDFTVGTYKLKNMETVITNLDPLSEAYGKKIDGMLGYSFISKGIICINFVRNELGIRFYSDK